MAEDVVLFEIDEGVATITLNRPESLNAMNRELSRRLGECMDEVRANDDIRVAIVTGNGRAFCAGADLKERARGESEGSAGNDATVPLQGHRRGGSRWTCPKPLLAAINGYALGGGFEMSLACDMRIAVPEARFGLPEITHGFFPGGGGPQRLPRAIPQALALEMIFTGDPIDAETALRAGLISRIVPADQLMEVAKQIAGRIAQHNPLAVEATKHLAYLAQDQPMEHALQHGNALRWIVGQTDAAKVGPRAFSEGRQS